MMLKLILAFLAIINPFAIFIYLGGVMEELSTKDFFKVLMKASLISFIIFAVFTLTGTWFFENVLNINFEAFRIFGGLIFFSFSYLFIVKGQKAFILMKEDLDDLASEIALPFMVGAGTISYSVLLGKELSPLRGLVALTIIMSITFTIVFFLKYLKDNLAKKDMKKAFDKNMQILMRLMGFFIGAIAIDMVIRGINNLYF